MSDLLAAFAGDAVKLFSREKYDEGVFDDLSGTTSSPFEAGEHGQIAVK